MGSSRLAQLLLFCALASPAARANASLWRCLDGIPDSRHVNASSPAALAEAADSWNRLYASNRPLGVVWPRTVDAIAGAVKCARSSGIQATPRCGGASFMNYAVRAGALTIDLSQLNKVQVSHDKKTVVVQGGARLGRVYYEMSRQAGDRTVVGGTCPGVGVGGHILGGGLGFLSNLHGMACDQLVSLVMVDADGNLVRANSRSNAKLLAASCGGGGGNFGIVVEMKLRTVPVAPRYTLSSLDIPSNRAAAFLEWYEAPGGLDEVADPRLFMEPRLDGGKVKLTLHYPGSKSKLESELRRVGLLGPRSKWVTASSLPSGSGETRELSWIQSALAFAGKNARNNRPEALLDWKYMRDNARDGGGFKEHSFCSLSRTSAANWQSVLDALNKAGLPLKWKRGGPKSAVAKVAPNATGFPWRKALWCAQLASRWKSPSEAKGKLQALEKARAALAPIFGQAAYINYLEGSIPLSSYLGPNLGWLQRVKARYDPSNYWGGSPLSIPPAAAAALPQ